MSEKVCGHKPKTKKKHFYYDSFCLLKRKYEEYPKFDFINMMTLVFILVLEKLKCRKHHSK